MTKNRILLKLMLLTAAVFLLVSCANPIPPPTHASRPTPAPPPPAKPASFTIANLTITPAEVTSGSKITIQVTLTNLGDSSGSYDVNLKIDDTVEATQDISLAGGASQNVTFVISKSIAKTYTVNVSELSGTFVVKSIPLPTPVVSTPSAPPPIIPTTTSTTPPAKALADPTWIQLQAFIQPLELGASLSPQDLKNKASAAGIRSGYAYITLDNGSKTIKFTTNVFLTTDYGLVCIDKSSTFGFMVWNLGVEGEFRGVGFSQVSPSRLHDASYWQNLESGYHFPGYTAKYSVSWQ